MGRLQKALRRLLRRLVLLAAVAATCFVVLRAMTKLDVTSATNRFIGWLDTDVPLALGCGCVVVLTALGTPLMVSTTPLNVGAGAVYGVVLGSGVALFGAVVGAWLCFFIARCVGVVLRSVVSC